MGTGANKKGAPNQGRSSGPRQGAQTNSTRPDAPLRGRGPRLPRLDTRALRLRLAVSLEAVLDARNVNRVVTEALLPATACPVFGPQQELRNTTGPLPTASVGTPCLRIISLSAGSSALSI